MDEVRPVRSEYSNKEIEDIIDSYVYSARDRLILKRRYNDMITFEALAEEFELSTAQVKRIVYKWSKIIVRYL